MPQRLRLKGPLGRSYNADPEDTVSAKTALASLGHYQPPESGITPYPDQQLIKGIRSFQKAQGLTADGVMKPGGETEKELDRVAFAPAIGAAPPIVIKIAEVFAMTVAAAYAWWLSMSNAERDEVRNKIESSNANPDRQNREKCLDRWETEYNRCPGWGPKWKADCSERANDRLHLCYFHGYTAPTSPEEWSIKDMEVSRNPYR